MGKVGRLTLSGTPEQTKALRPFAKRVRKIIGDRIDPVVVTVLPRASMPLYRDPRPGDGPTDGRAEGYWRGNARKILLADDLFDGTAGPLDETLGHEIIHVLFDDWIMPEQRRQLLPLLHPEPVNWSDTMVNGVDKGYPAIPEECVCVWGSAALFGFDPPAYDKLYKRRFVEADYAEVARILLDEY
jgi:hypothetical protein